MRIAYKAISLPGGSAAQFASLLNPACLYRNITFFTKSISAYETISFLGGPVAQIFPFSLFFLFRHHAYLNTFSQFSNIEEIYRTSAFEILISFLAFSKLLMSNSNFSGCSLQIFLILIYLFLQKLCLEILIQQARQQAYVL